MAAVTVTSTTPEDYLAADLKGATLYRIPVTTVSDADTYTHPSPILAAAWATTDAADEVAPIVSGSTVTFNVSAGTAGGDLFVWSNR